MNGSIGDSESNSLVSQVQLMIGDAIAAPAQTTVPATMVGTLPSALEWQRHVRKLDGSSHTQSDRCPQMVWVVWSYVEMGNVVRRTRVYVNTDMLLCGGFCVIVGGPMSGQETVHGLADRADDNPEQWPEAVWHEDYGVAREGVS